MGRAHREELLVVAARVREIRERLGVDKEQIRIVLRIANEQRVVLPEIDVDPGVVSIEIRLLIEAALPGRFLARGIIGGRQRDQVEIRDDRRVDRHAGRQERAAARRQAWDRLDQG